MRRAYSSLECTAGSTRGPQRVGVGRRHRQKVLAWVDELIALDVILLVVQLTIPAIGCDQLAVRSALDDPPVLHHEDLVRALDRRQAMRDDERRAPLPQR